jgi:D-aspartate ligase
VSTNRPPAIVASAGRQGLAVTRGLGERGVPVTVLHWDDDDLASASRYAARTVRVPRPELDGTAFVERLLTLDEVLTGGLLIPTTDAAVKDIARRREELARRFIVDCPPWSVAEQYIDKRRTYALAAEVGVPIPRTLVPASRTDLDAFDGQVEYPCLVKPRESHLWSARIGGKLRVVHSLEEMRAAYRAAEEADLDVVIQELIPGPDHYGVNYNAYRSRNGILAECTARKIRQGPPAFGLPRVVLSAQAPEVVEPGHRLLDALGIEGFACTEFKFDPRDGRYKLLEVNGRHNVSSLLSIRSGVNFPWIAYRWLVEQEAPPPIQPRRGLYWVDEWLDLAFNRTAVPRDADQWREMLRPWLRRHVFSVFDPRDMAPFRIVAREIVSDAARVLKRGAEKLGAV